MKKNVFNWMLMAAVACGLSLSTVACSDDDKDDASGTEQRSDIDPLDTDEARTAFRWLCALATPDGFDSHWQSKTWEPAIGQASENSQFTRLVVVEDLAEAKSLFADLADVETAQIGQKLTVNGGAAGTMTWTASAEGAENLAVVEVSSRIMPHLQKLVYCTQEQTGKNASMRGTAYYRFGDVVVDHEGYYWVCVRPSFAPKKDDSHWINIYNATSKGNKPGADQFEAKRPMHEGYIYDEYNHVPKYNNKTILLPTKLPYEREHIYNLNNLVWALLNPQKYTEMAHNNQYIGLGGFNYDFHGTNFVKAVAKFWDQVPEGYRHTVWELLFGLSRDEMSTLTELNFFYQGYRWWWGETPDFWIYKSTGYQNAKSGSESSDKVTNINVVTNGFDIRRYAGDPEADRGAGFEEHFVRNAQNEVLKGYWVVRYKSGDQLCLNGSRYDPYNKVSACEDVYRFNKKTGYPVGANEPQEQDGEIMVEEDSAIPEVGDVLAINGKFYKSESVAHNEGTEAIAMVVCVNNATPVEAGTDYYGLAMALEDVENGEFFPWGDNNSLDKTCPGEGGMVSPDQRARLADVLNGLSVTARLANHVCNATHNHSVAARVYNMQHAVTDQKEQAKFSRWFIPSSGQFILACRNMGYTWNGTAFTGNGQWKWGTALGWDDLARINGNHMTCTTSTGEAPSFYTFIDDAIELTPMTREVSVRPMLAFKKR